MRALKIHENLNLVYLYLLELKKNCKVTEPGERVIVKKLPAKDRGRPPLLGRKLYSFLKDRITSMRTRGAPIGTTVVIGVGRSILLKHDRRSLEEFGGHIKLGKEWAKSVFHRMGFSKRRGISKSKVTPDDLSILKENYLMDIKAVVEMEEIPEDMVVNWDQTAMKIVPSCTWTMEKRGTKRVEIKGVDDKRQITAVIACTVSGKFLPIQLIYQGTTTRCHPKGVMFPSDWHISCTSNHWSNEETMLEYIDKIIVPYFEQARKRHKLETNHSAIVIFDVFKEQCTEPVLNKLEDNNILYVLCQLIVLTVYSPQTSKGPYED